MGFLQEIGGEEGCRQLSAAFYARVGKDPVLKRLFPGKSLRCATEEFGAFLIQFLGGDEEQAQYRWWLSLRESHARFRITAQERAAWLKNMYATIDASPLHAEARLTLHQFFGETSLYVMGKDSADPVDEELGTRWREQCALDRTIAALAAGRDEEAFALAPQFAARPSVFVGLLARMVDTGRPGLIRFVVDALEREPSLAARRFGGKAILHYASGAGCVDVVSCLLRLGTDPNLLDRGGHTALYCLANQCACSSGPELVRTLVQFGADVNASAGVTRATPLHMAARRGHTEIAAALLDCGAAIDVRDSKGATALQRAINCRQKSVADLLSRRAAAPRDQKPL